MNPLLALRLALAGLRKDRSTSLAATGILALGLAAPATFFSLLWGGGFRPLPVPEGERVMRVEVLQARGGGRAVPVTFQDVALLEGVPGVEELGAFEPAGLALATPEMGTVPASGALMTPATFRLLRVAPALGRIPEGSEVRDALVLGHDLWMRHFDADPGILGRVVEVDGTPRTVVAVMPQGFQFPFRQAAWILTDLGATSAATPGSSQVEPVLRVAADADPELLAGRLTTLWQGEDALRPVEEREAVVRVRPFTHGRGESGEGWAFMGLVLVGLCLLLIACVNAANLLLVRALQRIRVLGVQSALGATRPQLAAQLFLEALILAVAGGAVGLVLAHFMVTWVQEVMGPENFGYYWMRMAIDGPVVLFTGILVLGTALAAGTLPVVRVLRADLQRVLKAGGEPAFHGPFRGWSWGRVFVTGQLALSCFALVAAGLTAGAMRTAGRFGAGLPGDEVLVASFGLEASAFPDPGARRDALPALEASLAGIPGARVGALALGAPGYFEPTSPVEVAGVEGPGERAFVNAVTPDFFPALDLELMQGRLLRAGDAEGSAPVAVVTESLARRIAPGADPLGMALRLPALDSARFYQVVGVVADPELNGGPRVRSDGVYLPWAQAGGGEGMILVRGTVTPALAREVRSAFAPWGGGVVLGELRTLEDGYRFMTRAQSTLSFLAVAGGLAGLLVAGAGLYALLAFRVRRARREMGIRLAVGADGRRLARSVVASALGQLLPAMAVGLVLAWLAAPLLGLILLGGDPRSPAAYTAVAAVFLLTGLAASLAPALRASRLQPAEVLGEE